MLIVASAIGAWLSPAAVGNLVTFEDLGLPANSYWNGSNNAGGFTSGGVAFGNSYNATYQSWDGWAYSSKTDTTTAGYANQYSAITGKGANGSSTYGVAYPDLQSRHRHLLRANDRQRRVLHQHHVRLPVDAKWRRFRQEVRRLDGNDPDWFDLTITG